MMMSAYAILFTIVLFSELNSQSVTVAMPSTKADDGATEQEGLDSILGDETMAESALVPLMQGQRITLDNNMKDSNTPKVIIISDTRLRGHSVRGLNSPITWSYPLLTERSLSHTPGEFTLKIDRRDKDLDMLRCMIGRVYRPCWEA